jgi:plastocyanin
MRRHPLLPLVLTFTTAGTFQYHCAAHCSQFEGGAVVVK